MKKYKNFQTMANSGRLTAVIILLAVANFSQLRKLTIPSFDGLSIGAQDACIPWKSSETWLNGYRLENSDDHMTDDFS
jgi:hypothetical protein